MRLTVLGTDLAPRGLAHQHGDQTVLEALEEARLRPRSGCRYGACRTCAARLVEGRVSMPPGTALTEPQLAAGFFLPCVSVARTDLVLELGGREGLLPVLPWTD